MKLLFYDSFIMIFKKMPRHSSWKIMISKFPVFYTYSFSVEFQNSKNLLELVFHYVKSVEFNNFAFKCGPSKSNWSVHSDNNYDQISKNCAYNPDVFSNHLLLLYAVRYVENESPAFPS